MARGATPELELVRVDRDQASSRELILRATDDCDAQISCGDIKLFSYFISGGTLLAALRIEPPAAGERTIL
jgi:hypothetical protein